MTLARGLRHCAAIWGVSLLLHASPAQARCTTAADCWGTRVCEQRTCVNANAPQRSRVQAEPGRKTRLRSVPLMVTGIVLTALGVQSGGLFGLAYVTTNICSSSDPQHDCGNSSLMVATGVGALVGIGVGIPLIVVGAQRVPSKPTTHLALKPWASRNAGGLRLSGNF